MNSIDICAGMQKDTNEIMINNGHIDATIKLMEDYTIMDIPADAGREHEASIHLAVSSWYVDPKDISLGICQSHHYVLMVKEIIQ